jgi:hypothetical protein
VDGSLTRAVERGGWVLLDNANLCNPTVLDRLNPLLEPGGVLQLSEAGGGGSGGGRVISPHPDFRLILCLDPRHGEVSRAMRNRGIEVFVLPPGADGASGAAAAGAAGAGAQVGGLGSCSVSCGADVFGIEPLARAGRGGGVVFFCWKGPPATWLSMWLWGLLLEYLRPLGRRIR